MENIITIMSGLLTEQKVLFVSSKYVLLITCMQSLIDLLLPLRWPHTYIPTVPSNLLEFVDAPTPYVMGAHVSQLEQLSSLDDVIVVDCDKNSVVTPSHYVALPGELFEWLRDNLVSISSKFGVAQKSKDWVEAEMEKIGNILLSLCLCVCWCHGSTRGLPPPPTARSCVCHAGDWL